MSPKPFDPASPHRAVDIWSCPTTVYAGPDSLRNLGLIMAGAPILLVTDSQIAAMSPVISDIRLDVAVAEEVVLTAGVTDAEAVEQVRAAIRRRPGAVPVAFGGGSVIDPVRLAALAEREAGFAERLRAVPDGLLVWPSAAASPVVVVPSTIGTAAEVSPVAILRAGPSTTMVISPALRARAAIIDPAVTASMTPTALAAGLIEPLARAVVPAIAGGRLLLQDQLAAALAATVLELGDQFDAVTAPSGEWRLAAALTSAQTHTAFLAVGRAPAGHVLWPFVTELMAAVAGLTKAQAMTVTFAAWLRELAVGSLGPALGSDARVAAILGMSAGQAVERFEEWFGRLGLNSRLPAGSVDGVVIADRVAGVWQAGGLFLRDVPRADIERLAAAIAG